MKKYLLLSLFFCIQLHSMCMNDVEEDMTKELRCKVDEKKLESVINIKKALTNLSTTDPQYQTSQNKIKEIDKTITKIEKILICAHRKYYIQRDWYCCCFCFCVHEPYIPHPLHYPRRCKDDTYTLVLRDTYGNYDENDPHPCDTTLVRFDANKIKPLMKELPWIKEVVSDKDYRKLHEKEEQDRQAKYNEQQAKQIKESAKKLGWDD